MRLPAPKIASSFYGDCRTAFQQPPWDQKEEQCTLPLHLIEKEGWYKTRGHYENIKSFCISSVREISPYWVLRIKGCPRQIFSLWELCTLTLVTVLMWLNSVKGVCSLKYFTCAIKCASRESRCVCVCTCSHWQSTMDSDIILMPGIAPALQEDIGFQEQKFPKY